MRLLGEVQDTTGGHVHHWWFPPSIGGFSSIAVGFKRAGKFHYAGKLEVYLPKSTKTEVLREFLPIASYSAAAISSETPNFWTCIEGSGIADAIVSC